MSRPLPPALDRIIREVTDSVRLDAGSGPLLLAQFVASRDEAAFRALVRLYGPLAWGVCQRVLRDPNDVEDAFQATFIVLARKAGQVARPDRLPAWLHGVALRAARKVRDAAARRREVTMAAVPDAAGPDPLCPDLCEVLDEELDRLPTGLRQVVVLCHLEGRTYAEAARVVGCSTSTVGDRLARAADLLRVRLGRRGLAAVGMAGVAVPNGLAGVSAHVVDRAVGGALGLAAGRPSAAAVVAADAVARGMVGPAVWKAGGLALLMAVGVGAGVVASRDAAPVAPPRPVLAPAEPRAGRADRFGDPLPDHAVARLGTLRFRTGRVGGAGDVAFLPNGRGVVSVHGDGLVRLWDAATGAERWCVEAPDGCRSVTVAADGRRLAVAGAGEVRVWDMGRATPLLLWTRPLARGSSAAAGFSPDGSVLACGDADEPGVLLLDAATGEVCCTLAGSLAGQRPVFSPDGQLVVTAARGQAPCVRDTTTGAAKVALAVPAGYTVCGAAFAPDGRTLVTSAREQNSIRVWDAATGREVRAWEADARAATLAFLPGGRGLVESAGDTVRFRDPVTGREVGASVPIPRLLAYPGRSLSPAGNRLAVAGPGEVVVFELPSGSEVGPPERLHGRVQNLAFSRSGRTVATLTESNAVHVWDAATGELVWKEQLAPVPAQAAAQTARTDLLFQTNHSFALWVAGRDASLDDRGLTPARAPGRSTGTPTPDGRWVLSAEAGADGTDPAEAGATTLQVYDRATGRKAGSVRVAGPVEVVGLTAGGLVAVRGGARQIELWAVRNGVPHRVMGSTPDDPAFQPAAVSADGRWLAGTSWRNSGQEVVVRDAGGGAEVGRFSVGQGAGAVALSADGRLAVGELDGAVCVFDLATGREGRRLTGHRAAVRALVFAPDGRRLASGSDDGTGLVWDVTPAGPTRDAR